MSPSISISATGTAVVAAVLSGCYALWKTHSPQAKRRRLREMLPKTLATWRLPDDNGPDYEYAWNALGDAFREAGFQFWPYDEGDYLIREKKNPLSSGYAYVEGHRTDPTGAGMVSELRFFQTANSNLRPARTSDGHDVLIRIIAIQNEGQDHLRILRKIATGVNSLFSNNHALPMLAEFQFEDMTFGIFPRVGSSMVYLYGYYARNSAGDIVEVIMQMLEALAFIHKLNIAHRDAFKDNFVMQWQPESFKTMSISPSRPRVYLIDFEVAVEFRPDCPTEERVVTGYPFDDVEEYTRPHAPELTAGESYSPFKLDIWQLAQSLLNVRSTIPKIDKVLDDMYHTDPDQRPTAQDASERIQAVVNSIPPKSLLISPWMEDDWFGKILAEQQKAADEAANA